MSTIVELKQAVGNASESDRYELLNWLRDGLREREIERLRSELAEALAEEARGERVPFDFAAIKAEGRRMLVAEQKQSANG
jgi:Arc/MetJ-type ribon-helix-helix transcriptional regulator